MNFVYVIGVPGAGKTTLVERTTASLPGIVRKPKGEPAHTLYVKDDDFVAAELGYRRERFGGTDALPMNAQPMAIRWLRGGMYPDVFAEGDRLANIGFFTAVEEAGYMLTVVLLDALPALAEQRRQERGSLQDPTWLKGRITKVWNLFEAWHGTKTTIAADSPLDVQAAKLWALPVFRHFSEVGDAQVQ